MERSTAVAIGHTDHTHADRDRADPRAKRDPDGDADRPVVCDGDIEQPAAADTDPVYAAGCAADIGSAADVRATTHYPNFDSGTQPDSDPAAVEYTHSTAFQYAGATTEQYPCAAAEQHTRATTQ